MWDRGWRDTGAPTADAPSIAALEIKGYKCPADTTNQDPAPLNYVVNSRICRDLTNPANREAYKKSSSDIATASTTILLAERLKSTPTVTGPWVTISGTAGTSNNTATALTFTWLTSGVAGSVLSSPHGNGALVTFADSRTEFIKDNVDCTVYLPTTLPGVP